ncbi:S8 family serine peptidase [Micromonospora viridifaciens]|nr:S8 family serine peptidase [Micromonospora viridifaciens]
MLLVLGLAETVVAAPTRPAPVEPALYSTLATDGTADFWVYLRDRADLSGAARMPDRAAQGRFVYEKLTGTARASQAGLVAMLKAAGASHQPYWIANTVRVTGDAALLKRIAARPEVTQITADHRYQIATPEAAGEEPQIAAVEWNISRVNAPQVWQQFAVTGEDIVIGSIDTGVRYDHPALVKQYRGNLGNGTFDHNYNWWDPSNVCGAPSLVPCDNNNHGTHTVGTMVGNDGGANQIGVAPGAKWMAAKGCESNSCTDSALLSSGQFMLAPTDLRGKNPNPALRPHIINNSWGGSATTSPWYQPTVQAWVAAGIFPQFSSGNPGSACAQAGNPGNLPEAYSAGAFDVNGALYVNSGRGPSAWGADLVKPNIAAPGVAVRSSLATGGYGALTGTSMASPHVAGVVALLWSAAPSLERDIAATRAVLDGSAVDTADLTCGGTSGNNNVWGQGKLDALAAVTQAPRPAKGQLTGTVLAAGTNTPVAGATITIAGSVNRTRTTGPDGRYAITLPVGSYTVTASAFGYESASGPATVVEGGTVARDFALVPPGGRHLSVTPGSLDFGVTKIGDTAGPLTVTLTGTGAEPATVSAITEPGGGFARLGGTCGALPVTLSHLQSCTVAYTFTPTVEEPATASVTVTSDAADSPQVITLEGVAIRVPLRVDAAALAAGENVLFSGLVDPAGRYAYFGTQTSPGRVVKVDLSTFRRVGAITLADGENYLNSAVIDPAGRYAYFGTGTSPGRIVKIDLATFQRVGTITLGNGESYLRSAVIDPTGRYAYFGTGTAPGRVVKIDLTTFQRVNAATLSSGVDNLRSAVIDPAGRYAYFGTGTSPGLVAKLDLTAFAEAGVIAMVSESLFYSAVIDPAGRYAYFGTGTSPGRIVKIDLVGFQRVEAIELATDENSLLSAAIDPAGRFAYFGTGTAPGGVVKIELAGFQRVGAATLADGENSLLSAVIDPQGGFVYLGTLSSPGRVVKVKVDTAIQLRAAAQRVRGNPFVNLTWDGATSTNVDVFRDGTLVATVPNNGTYADAVNGSGAVTYTYRVCHAGTLKCSNKVTVRFGGQQ